MTWFGSPAIWWLIAAAVLAIAELVAPGVFLIFLAAAAAIVGVLALIFPDLPLAGQLVGFAAWAVIAVLLGRRYYATLPVESSDPLLNARAARLVGETLVVTQAIIDGHGRVRVGDGEWPARGPDAPTGARVLVIDAEGASLKVEPLPQREIPAT